MIVRKYSEEEKQTHLDSFKVSGKSKTLYARENNIPEATFRAWVRDEQYKMFGAVELGGAETVTNKIVKPIIFCDEKIRIELKDGYDKEYLKKIIEVISI